MIATTISGHNKSSKAKVNSYNTHSKLQTTSVNVHVHAQIFRAVREGVPHIHMFDKMASSGKQPKSVHFPKTKVSFAYDEA